MEVRDVYTRIVSFVYLFHLSSLTTNFLASVEM